MVWGMAAHAKGGRMAESAERKERRAALHWKLFSFGLLGVAFVMLSHAPEGYAALGLGVLDEIGKALIVAAVLGWAVDLALKQDLVRDAVEAALGYLLPPQLRNEMEWVYGQNLMAEQTFNIVLEHQPEKHTVIVHATYDRIIRNLSRETVKVRIAGGTDEWYRDSPATIHTAEYRYLRDGKYQPTVKLAVKRAPGSIGYGSEEKIDLRPDEMIHLTVAYDLPCPDNGMESLTYRYPIENPVVQVRVPNTLRAHINIRHRGHSYPYKDWETGYISARLDGTLLPHQDIYVLWHRADDLDSHAA
jgi:hypothetical protein